MSPEIESFMTGTLRAPFACVCRTRARLLQLRTRDVTATPDLEYALELRMKLAQARGTTE